ncbi:uncharacterized protein [Henckelia pumila]|uniref:uncharacterized protein isoform X1 n=2 Tax=Henckelia pumila TaxID=405737 RepID=UPI003C6E7EF5
MGKSYVVFKGRNPGIYSTWEETDAQVTGFRLAEHKSYHTREDVVKAYTKYMEKNHSTQASPCAPKKKGKTYVVYKGLNPGIYDTWEETDAQVTGFRCAVHKAFNIAFNHNLQADSEDENVDIVHLLSDDEDDDAPPTADNTSTPVEDVFDVVNGSKETNPNLSAAPCTISGGEKPDANEAITNNTDATILISNDTTSDSYYPHSSQSSNSLS